MSSAHGLKALAKEHEAMMSESGSASSLSSLVTPESRNELSDILSKMRLSSSSFTATSPEPSSEELAKKKEDSDVVLQRRALRIIAHETDKAANNIVLHVKYATSPLRLYLKTQLQTKPVAERVALANTIKISDAVKADLVSDWNIVDSFGLKMLVKLYRLHQNVMPMLASHEDFMRYFKPLYDADHVHRKPITFYLFNNVMNPGVVYYTYEQTQSLEHAMHQWLDGFLIDFKDDLEEVGFSLDDAKQDLIAKITFELNVYASIVFKKPLTFKYSTGERVSFTAEALLKELHTAFAASAGTAILAEQMMFWLANDEPMVGAPRAITGGSMCPGTGWTGGRGGSRRAAAPKKGKRA